MPLFCTSLSNVAITSNVVGSPLPLPANLEVSDVVFEKAVVQALIWISQNGEHDNVNQLQIQHNSSSPKDLVIDSVPGVRKKRDQTGQFSSRLEQQGTTNQHPRPTSSKRRRTSLLKVGSELVLKTSTYPNKRNVPHATIRSTDRATKAGGI